MFKHLIGIVALIAVAFTTSPQAPANVQNGDSDLDGLTDGFEQWAADTFFP